MRGQVAFETLFVFIIILTAAIYISSLYLQTNTVTLSESIARASVTEQAALAGQPIVIERISYENGLPPTITITLFAQHPSSLVIDTTQIASRIQEVTGVSGTVIVLNKKQL